MTNLLNPTPDCTRGEAQEVLKHAQHWQGVRGSDYLHLQHLLDTRANEAIHLLTTPNSQE